MLFTFWRVVIKAKEEYTAKVMYQSLRFLLSGPLKKKFTVFFPKAMGFDWAVFLIA